MSFKTIADQFDLLNNLNDLTVLNLHNAILLADLVLIANDDGDEFFRLEIARGDP